MSQSLKKAAILIATLDSASADALLDKMDPEEATRVRNAVMELGEIDPLEQQTIIHDFMNRDDSRTTDHPGVELDPALAERLRESLPGPTATEVPLSATAGRRQPVHASDATPFECLNHVGTDALATLLARENPQTTAIVVAHLAPERSAALLQRMPKSLQTEILVRVARFHKPDPAVIRDIENEMKSLLAKNVDRDTLDQDGLAAVDAILRAAASEERRDLVASLARRDAALARQLGKPKPPEKSTLAQQPLEAGHATGSMISHSPGQATPRQETPLQEKPNPENHAAGHGTATTRSNVPTAPCTSFSFVDMETLDDQALAHILHASSPNTTLLALAGASHEFVQRILSQLPTREAGQLRRKMQQLGPLRLDDVERAQWQLAELARQMINDGKLVSPINRRFAVAA